MAGLKRVFTQDDPAIPGLRWGKKRRECPAQGWAWRRWGWAVGPLRAIAGV